MPRTKKATTGIQVDDTNPAGNSASNSDPPPTPNTNRRIFHDVCTTANIPADRLERFRLALIAQETSKHEGGIDLIASGKKPLELDELKGTVVKKELKKWVGENLTKEQAKLVDKAGILKNKRQRKKVAEVSASSADANGEKEVEDINGEVLSERPGDINKIAGVTSVAAKEKGKGKEKEKEKEKEGEKENENGNENAKEKEKEKEKEKGKTKGKKRKSNELENEGTQAAAVQEPVIEIDWDADIEFTWSCGEIRRKIKQFIENGGMKVTEFQRTIGANSNSYGRFMKLREPWSGIDNSTFSGATRFFKAREAANLPMPKKPKLAAAAATGPSSAGTAAAAVNNLDISTVHLDGEDTDSVPVFDSCDEIRRKISAHLRKPDVTQAQFLRDIAAQFKTDMVRIQGKQLTDFRTKSGPLSGNTSRVYYGAYVYFEKLRVKEGKAKSKHRLEMENRWKAGVDRENANGGWIIAHKDDIVSRDQWGTLHIHRRHG